MPQDDPAIGNNELLYRHIHPSQVSWNQPGCPVAWSAAFRDCELSVNLGAVMARAGRAPEDCLRGYAGYGLVEFTAGAARALHQIVFPDPQPDEPAHGIVYGEKPRSVSRRLRDAARWVVSPKAPGAP